MGGWASWDDCGMLRWSCPIFKGHPGLQLRPWMHCLRHSLQLAIFNSPVQETSHSRIFSWVSSGYSYSTGWLVGNWKLTDRCKNDKRPLPDLVSDGSYRCGTLWLAARGSVCIFVAPMALL